LGGSNELVHDIVGMNILRLPWAGLEGEGNVSGWGFGPGSVLSTNILSFFSDEVVLWNWEELSESLLDKVDVFFVVFDSTGNNKALSWGNVVHDKLLKHSSVNVIDVLLESESWHTKGVVTISSSQQKLLLGSEWVELGQVVVKIVGLSVLGSSNVRGHDGSWLKSNINHHLEHVNNIVFNALSLEIGSLLIVIHGHGTTRHLDHTIVDSFIGVLEGLQIGVLQGEEGSRCSSSLISGSNVHKESHVYGSWEALTFGQNGESVGEVSNVVLMWNVLSLDWLVTLKWLGWVESSDAISSSSLIKGVENSVNNTWVGTECSFLKEKYIMGLKFNDLPSKC